MDRQPERIHSREGDAVGLERHVVLVGMVAAGETTRGGVSAGPHDVANDETPPDDPQFATEPVAPAARPGAPEERSGQ